MKVKLFVAAQCPKCNHVMLNHEILDKDPESGGVECVNKECELHNVLFKMPLIDLERK